MTVVRELLISFGSELNKSSLSKVDRQAKNAGKKSGKSFQESFRSAIENVAGAALLFGAGKGALALTRFASDAQETLNVLEVAFQENQQSVRDWASEYADRVGRSRFEMEKTAGTLGALLTPMMEGNAEASAEMATRLTELTTDLGSLYNIADNDALTALRSALVGEMEPMRRLGVNMSVAALEAFALEKGIRGSYKSMGEAERTTLRYNFLVEKTGIAHGDAEKTAEAWANKSKAVRGKIKDLATAVGLKLLPFMTKLANGAAFLLSKFDGLVKNSKFAEAALITLGAVAAGIGVKLAIALAPVLLPMLKIAAIITAVTLVVEDFLTFLDGGDSLIGRFIDSIWGPGSAGEAATKLKQAFSELGVFFKDFVLPALAELAAAFGDFFREHKSEIKDVAGVTGDAIKMMVEGWRSIFELLGSDGEDVWNGFKLMIEEAVDSIQTTVGGLFEKFAEWFGVDLEKYRKKILEFGSAAASFLGFESASENLEAASKISGNTTKKQETVFTSRGAALASTGSSPTNITQTTNVNVAGNATPATAGKIGKAATSGMGDLARKTVAGLRQRKKS
jgi:hypothetical protein